MSTPSAHHVDVALSERSYRVEIGMELLTALGRRMRNILIDDRASRAFVVIDDGLPEEFVAPALASLKTAGFTVTRDSAIASEKDKSLATVERLLEAIACTRHERTDPVIAIGGGIVGDVAGFVAATYRRGVPVIQCPTTLLSMVDASVGGKTGVNLTLDGHLLKNMAGAFWQPRLVIADIAALRSLPDRQLRAGFAECLKHGLIAATTDAELFDWTIANLPRLHCRDEQCLSELVTRNVAVKARVVETDEREEAISKGGRALLNLGHTFAHAIETIPHLSPDGDPAKAPLLHGEAVAIGLVAAAATSAHFGNLDRSTESVIRDAVAQAGLPIALAGLPSDDEILSSMHHDKKVTGGRLRLVLPVESDGAIVINDVPEDSIRAGLAAIRARD